MSDTGALVSADGSFEFEVLKVLSFAGYVMHIGKISKGNVKLGHKLLSKVSSFFKN